LQVEPATTADLTAIRAAYAQARAIQREQGSTVWPEFSDAAILGEVVGHRRIDDDPRLPAHYHGLEFALLEHACKP